MNGDATRQARSIRTRLILGFGIMALPLVILAIGGYWLHHRTITAFELVMDEVLGEMEPITHLQLLIMQARTPPVDYLTHGRPENRETFSALKTRLNEAFADAFSMSSSHTDISPAIHEKKSQILSEIHHLWTLAENDAEKILSLAQPVGDPTGQVYIQDMDEKLQIINTSISIIHALSHSELSEHDEEIDRLQRYIQQLIAIILIISAGMIGAGIVYVLRSIMRPLKILESGVSAMRDGNLKKRILLDSDDEMGDLARTFNSMAHMLEQDRAELQRIAAHDHLTGLLNKREFMKQFSQEMERSARYDHPFSLLMIDIDHFKKVNDEHGHLVGDEALRQVAQIVRHTLRPMDVVGRYGGEEFTAVLPETDRDAAYATAERVREQINAQPLILGKESLCIAVSIGVACYPDHGQDINTLFNASDAALYAAKGAGRNRVFMAEPTKH